MLNTIRSLAFRPAAPLLAHANNSTRQATMLENRRHRLMTIMQEFADEGDNGMPPLTSVLVPVQRPVLQPRGPTTSQPAFSRLVSRHTITNQRTSFVVLPCSPARAARAGVERAHRSSRQAHPGPVHPGAEASPGRKDPRPQDYARGPLRRGQFRCRKGQGIYGMHRGSYHRASPGATGPAYCQSGRSVAGCSRAALAQQPASEVVLVLRVPHLPRGALPHPRALTCARCTIRNP